MAIDELNKMFITTNRVIRDGKKHNIDSRNIVVGDIVELESGDYISFDGRIITCDDFKVNEATLTGESDSIEKNSEIIHGKRELYNQTNMVFAGCNTINGRALVIVTATGMNTELSKIASSLSKIKKDITPLQKKVNDLGRVLTYIVLFIILVMVIVGLIKGDNFIDVLMFSISLAVAAIPEGLSSIITVILSLGMASMARKKVIIRKMSSVETLGSADVICSDKTGTITQNQMKVKSLFVNDHLYKDTDKIENDNILKLCAFLNHNVEKNNDLYIGDETEVALYKYLENINFPIDGSFKRIKEFPFDSIRKMMTTINEINGKMYSFTKGSLDSIINNCSKYLLDDTLYEMNEEFLNHVKAVEKEQSLKSLRLLAFAYKNENLDKPEEDMIFIGLIGMTDPPRESVANAIMTCQKSGIRPIMITGDSINTAIAIAKEVGIIDDADKAIEGKYIDTISDEELTKVVDYYQVYARITPSSKLRIVETLQSEGLVVAMTGDGVNDAPAIQKAGIGMGITGTEVVKKVADCILVDDSFSTIVDGVEEGKRITSNIRKVILYLLAGNIIEVLLVFISMLLNKEMFTTLQLLWLNLVTDSIPAIMLVFEKTSITGNSDLPDEQSSKSFFTPFLISRMILSAFIKSIIMLITYFIFTNIYNQAIAGSLMFIFLISIELLFAFSCRNLKYSVLNKKIFNNVRLTLGVIAIILLQIIIFTSGLSSRFIVNGLTFKMVSVTLGLSFIVFVLGEFMKQFYRKLFIDYNKDRKQQ